MKTKKVKSAGRFGPRYGRRVRVKIAEIESEQRKKQQCIFCGGRAKRLSKGIWLCLKCGRKFAGNTFMLKSGVEFAQAPEKKQKNSGDGKE